MAQGIEHFGENRAVDLAAKAAAARAPAGAPNPGPGGLACLFRPAPGPARPAGRTVAGPARAVHGNVSRLRGRGGGRRYDGPGRDRPVRASALGGPRWDAGPAWALD